MAQPQGRRAAPPVPKGQSYMLIMMMLMLFIIIDPSLSRALGTGMALLLDPTIGFDGHMPVLSIMLAGLFTGLLSTGLRHWSTDYIQLERGRVLQRTFSKEMMEARAKQDIEKVEKLRRAQPFMMSHTMSAQYATMKPAVGTMVLALAVYGWMIVFLSRPGVVAAVSLPWAVSWPMPPGSLQMMFLYAIMSLPVTLVASSALKLWRFRNFDPKAELKPIPTVAELVRRADGEKDDEAVVRKESAKARRRLGVAAPVDDEDGEALAVEDADDEDVQIVDADEGGKGEGGGGVVTARVADGDASAGDPREEE